MNNLSENSIEQQPVILSKKINFYGVEEDR